MAYFGFSFWDVKTHKNLGTSIVEGDTVKEAVEKAIKLEIFPVIELENGRGAVVASEIPSDKLKYFPIEMIDSRITLEKLNAYIESHPDDTEVTKYTKH